MRDRRARFGFVRNGGERKRGEEERGEDRVIVEKREREVIDFEERRSGRTMEFERRVATTWGSGERVRWGGVERRARSSERRRTR